jgi:hypothetical protein
MSTPSTLTLLSGEYHQSEDIERDYYHRRVRKKGVCALDLEPEERRVIPQSRVDGYRVLEAMLGHAPTE